jgi:hypothetical protein
LTKRLIAWQRQMQFPDGRIAALFSLEGTAQ